MSDNLLYGPEDTSNLPKISMGTLIHQELKQRNGDAVAMVDAFTGQSITYGDILKESTQLANALEKKGIKRDDVIGIASENSLRYCVPVIASLYIGAISNPFNPSYTIREFKHSMGLSKPKIVFCSQFVLKTIIDVKSEVDYIEEIVVFGPAVEGTISYNDFLAFGGEDEIQPKDYGTEQVAAILPSSGTMGLAKGVMITHKNMRETFVYIQDEKYGGFRDGEVTIGVLPSFHVFGLFVQLGAILFSTKVVIMAMFKPDVFMTSIQQFKITKLFLVPPIAIFLAKHPIVSKFDLSSVKDIFCSAAPLGADIQNLLEQRVGKVRQAYGLTEICGCATLQKRNVSNPGSSGSPINGICAKVVDLDTNVALGPNLNGELCFKGDMVMKGYVGDTESTAATIDKDGFLHSGDIGYYDEEGSFYIVDRLKELIKYKGYQVPPAELEDILVSHPAIKEAGVVGIPDERSGELPIAFVVKQPNAEVTEKEIIDFVAEQVSEQKQLYGGVRFIDELPKTPVGKILRRKLRELLN